MKVTNWQLDEQADTVEISADIDSFRLWYRLPKSYDFSRSGDPFLASAILPAMRQGEPLEIDPCLPVSPKLLRNISVLQEIFHTWNPVQLKIIPVHATTSRTEPLNNKGVMSFFSGGVDGTYTFLKHQDEISHLCNIHGFDFYFNGASGDAIRFSTADLKDLAQFAWKLMLPHGPVSAYIKDMLSKATQQVLSTYRLTGAEPKMVEAALIEDLNEIITGDLIFEPTRFSNVNLREQTKELLVRALNGAEVARVNRLLLEDAYPREISGKYSGTYQTALDRNTRFVQGFGKSLIPVETNHYSFGYRYNLSRNLTQGSVLGSVALLLGFPHVYVPNSYTYNQLFPLGSHPLTDPLWSNECVEIIHDGCEAERTEKTKLICRNEAALMNLRVCFDDVNTNCGKCPKCLRTMIALKLLNAPVVPFPPFPPLEVIRKMPIGGEMEMTFFKEYLDLALQVGNREILDALQFCVKRQERKRLPGEIDRLFFGGRLKRMRRGMRRIRGIVPAPEGDRRIDTVPPPLDK